MAALATQTQLTESVAYLDRHQLLACNRQVHPSFVNEKSFASRVNSKPPGMMHGQSQKVYYRATLNDVVFAVVRCLSVTLVHCSLSARLKISSNFFSPCGFIILVFWPPVAVPNSKGNPFKGSAKYTGGGKILRFSTEFAVYLDRKWYEIGPGFYGTLIGSHKWRIYLCQLQWTWMTSDPDFKVTTFLKSNISKTVRLLGTKLLY